MNKKKHAWREGYCEHGNPLDLSCGGCLNNQPESLSTKECREKCTGPMSVPGIPTCKYPDCFNCHQEQPKHGLNEYASRNNEYMLGTTYTVPVEKWEQRFDETFASFRIFKEPGIRGNESVKDFIRTEIQKAKYEGYKLGYRHGTGIERANRGR